MIREMSIFFPLEEIMLNETIDCDLFVQLKCVPDFDT